MGGTPSLWVSPAGRIALRERPARRRDPDDAIGRSQVRSTAGLILSANPLILRRREAPSRRTRGPASAPLPSIRSVKAHFLVKNRTLGYPSVDAKPARR